MTNQSGIPTLHLKTRDMFSVENKQDQPRDTVQIIRWLPGARSTIFACAGWDGKLRVYELVKKNYASAVELRCCINLQAPVISMEWCGERALYAGTADSKILEVDISNGKINQFASPPSPVQEIKLMDDRINPAVLFFHMDERLTIFFPKATNSNNRILDIKLQSRILCADIQKETLIVACENMRILICKMKDIDRTSSQSYLESPLGKDSKISHIALRPDLNGFTAMSVDGRIAYCTMTGGSYSSTFNFKGDIVFRGFKAPGSNPNNKTHDTMSMPTGCQFSTSNINVDAFLGSSSSGELKIWDINLKQDLISYETEGRHDISAVRCNSDFTLCAMAIGYSWAQGVSGLAKIGFSPEILVFIVDEQALSVRRRN